MKTIEYMNQSNRQTHKMTILYSYFLLLLCVVANAIKSIMSLHLERYLVK